MAIVRKNSSKTPLAVRWISPSTTATPVRRSPTSWSSRLNGICSKPICGRRWPAWPAILEFLSRFSNRRRKDIAGLSRLLARARGTSQEYRSAMTTVGAKSSARSRSGVGENGSQIAGGNLWAREGFEPPTKGLTKSPALTVELQAPPRPRPAPVQSGRSRRRRARCRPATTPAACRSNWRAAADGIR